MGRTQTEDPRWRAVVRAARVFSPRPSGRTHTSGALLRQAGGYVRR